MTNKELPFLRRLFGCDRTDVEAHTLEQGGVGMQQCRMVELRYKEVINVNDGCRLGYVGDVEIRLPEGQVAALIVPGPCRFFGLFGRGEDYYVPWDCIKQIGDDIILIEKSFQRREPYPKKKGRRWF